MHSQRPREILLRWLLALGCFALLIDFFSPSWGAFRLWSRVPEMSGMLEVRRGVAVLEQVAHPGAPVADELHRAIQWRLLFPAIGHVLNLPPSVFFALADLGCVLVLGYLVTLLRQKKYSWSDTALATLMLGAASWFFTSMGWLGYFDSWFVLALLLVAFAKPRWVVWLACLLAPWVDERFAAAAPLALLCRWLHCAASTPAVRFDWRREASAPAALLAVFLVVRLGVLSGSTAAGATVGSYLSARDYLDAPPSRIALGVWEGLRMAWIFVVIGVVGLWPRRGRALLLGATVLGLVAIGVSTAQDYSRAMTMVFPVAVLGLLLPWGAWKSWQPLALRIGAGVALLLPAHHVMNDLVNPIFDLQHELAVLRTPPPIAMPELYELHAIHEMERGEFTQADADLALAIKLAENPASPAKQRGILAANQGHWADALRYFSLMAEHDTENPDAWFMCAQANLALGRAPEARSSMEHALGLAPKEWNTRQDVARFLVRLQAAAGK